MAMDKLEWNKEELEDTDLEELGDFNEEEQLQSMEPAELVAYFCYLVGNDKDKLETIKSYMHDALVEGVMQFYEDNDTD